MTTPTSNTTADAVMACAGTWRADSSRNRRGASSCRASVYSIRPLLKIPLSHADVAAVRTTKLTMPAAPAMPTRSKTTTNGLWSAGRSLQTTSDMITAIAPT